MSDQAEIRKIRNIRPNGQVRMIPLERLEEEVELQAGMIARVLLSESMKSMKTDDAQQAFLQKQIETILKQVGQIYQCTEFTFVEDGSAGLILT